MYATFCAANISGLQNESGLDKVLMDSATVKGASSGFTTGTGRQENEPSASTTVDCQGYNSVKNAAARAKGGAAMVFVLAENL